jgi:hypothetical protein
MKLWMKRGSLAVVFCISLVGCRDQKREEPKMSTESPLAAKIRRFAPTDITADPSHLSEGDRKALDKIIEAAKLLDPLYLRQVWSGNEELKKKLEADTSAEGKLRLHYFMINKGPWSRLDKDEPFIEGVPHEKPPQAGFYPDDMTKEEFNSWVAGLTEDERQRATGFFFTVRRGPDGKLKSVPYSEEYGEFLGPAATFLNQAAELTTNQTLKDFLSKRAEAFQPLYYADLGRRSIDVINPYYASDVAWMDLDAPIEVTIGPYETYEDELFGYKAAFEAFVTLRDEAESAKLVRFSGYLQELEDNLPIDAKYRNPKLGAASPIRVVDVVFSSADGNRGVQTAAFNLPNDEKVVKEKGSKRVMLKNMQEAKFNKVLTPISKVVLEAKDVPRISFDAFFTHILAHELMHGLGPHDIKVDGKDASVRKQLKDLYSTIEEAKADITGLWALQYLIDKGALDHSMEQQMYATFLASMFRSVRFGLTEAHAKGIAMQFNYLVDEGGITVNESAGTFSVNEAKIKEAARKLTHDLLTLEAEGSYDKAKAMLDKYVTVRPAMQKALDKLGDVPVDIEPRFTLAK